MRYSGEGGILFEIGVLWGGWITLNVYGTLGRLGYPELFVVLWGDWDTLGRLEILCELEGTLERSGYSEKTIVLWGGSGYSWEALDYFLRLRVLLGR